MRIEDYGLIGDTQTAALVGRNGSIDWLCLPRFDSGACFAALLGSEEHGFWRISPAEEATVRRRYREDTLVLETEFESASGCVRLIDCMPPRQRDPDLVRLVEGVRGTVRMEMRLVIRFDYGSIEPWIQQAGAQFTAVGGPDALTLWPGVETRMEGSTLVASFEVRAGEQVPFVLMWHPSHEAPEKRGAPQEEMADTERWWRQWISTATCENEWCDAVKRSLITLKALTYAPTGGIVAAPTTSLPEQLGGVRNWDYRFCWLRDATFTLYSLLMAGYQDEAIAWRDWLLRSVAGDPSQLQIMYGVRGERRLEEREVPWLPGYEASRPVRIGNAASRQYQLDVYGELIDAMYQVRCTGLDPVPRSWTLQCAVMDFLETGWSEPDEGIWEVRGQRRHFTHSKIMAWVAFDRAIKMVEKFGLQGPVERWRWHRQRIHDEVCARGFNARIGAFTQEYDGERLDGSLLMTPLVGFLPATDERVRGTVAAIERGLVVDGFVQRYATAEAPPVDGLPPGEAAFLPCSFWLADNYALMGRRDEAREVFERLLAIRNDVGLLAEEYDPKARRLLGNFPQAFSHVGLINTARNLSLPGGPAQQRHAESTQS